MVNRFILNEVSYFGPGARKELPGEIARLGLHKAFVASDKDLVKFGVTGKVLEVLDEAGIPYEVFSDIKPNPTVTNVKNGVEAFRKSGADFILAIGGGSSMDCAKAVGARVAYPNKPLSRMKGVLRVLKATPPIIAIPTTAGTGSEVTLAAVITDGNEHHKYAIMSFPLIPHYAVLDARLTYTLPPHLTSTTGMDALTHAVEAYIGRSTTKQTRELALDATKLIFGNIQRAYEHGDDHEARENMLHAAYKAGIAFSMSYVGYVHAIAHSLGGQYGVPHGLANAVILPYVLEAYGEAAHKKLHQLGVAAGVCAATDSDAEGAARFIAAIKELNASMNIPEKISGIKRDDIAHLAHTAEREANPLYPVPKLMTEHELAALYEEIADWNE